MKQRYVKVGKRSYSHDSVLRLIERHSEISHDPVKIIRSLVQRELAQARQSKFYKWCGPPFNPQTLASIMGIPCEESEKLFHSEDAELHPAKDGGLVIRYNPDKPKTRRNFSIAHEIVHAFFPEYQDRYKARHKAGKFDPGNEVEFLCDLGASEIIMPTPDFDLDVESMGVSLKSLRELSNRYETSLEATAIRMIGTDLYPCALMVLDYSHKPVEIDKIEASKYQHSLFGDYPWEPPPMKLRVQYSVRSRHFSPYIPMHKSIDESSPLYSVSVTREPFRGNIILNFTNLALDMYVEAIALPKVHNTELASRILVLLLDLDYVDNGLFVLPSEI